LTEDEQRAAARTLLNAHYTSPDVIDAMWSALERWNFQPPAKVLEPGMGLGHFIGLGPHDRTAYTGVELDPITGRIARLLYPQADVRVQGFETLTLPGSHFDLAIGNVPFADVRPYDPEHNPDNLVLHDYFIAKALDLVRPGGVVAVVTSHYTMDKQKQKARRAFSRKAELLGAIRLPNTAFRGNAGTDVTTDILFFRRHPEGTGAPTLPEWTALKEITTPDGPTRINAYFAAHPEMMLGEMRLVRGQYGPNEPALVPRETDPPLRAQIIEAAERIDFTYEPATAGGPAERVEALAKPPAELDDGAFFVGEGGELMIKEGAVARPAGITTKAGQEKVRALVAIRDALRAVLRLDLAGGRADEARAELNRRYDAFVAKHGPINRTKVLEQRRTVLDDDGNPALRTVEIRRLPNLHDFRNDPDAWTVASLEVYDESTDTATKAALLERPTITRERRVERVDEPRDALTASLNERGRVDLARMAEMLGLTEDQAEDRLAGLILLDPMTGALDTPERVLSGNVRAKLARARKSLANLERGVGGGREHQRAVARMRRTFEALKAAQPTDLEPKDIHAELGAVWIDGADVAAFVDEITGASGTRASFLAETGYWSLQAPREARRTVQSTGEWGTEDLSAVDLVGAILNKRQIVVRVRTEDGSVVDPVATANAQEKADRIKKRFREWVWEDEARARRLARRYNDEFNNLVVGSFDGSHLRLPGASNAIELHPHQKNAVWRIVQTGNTLLDHIVGSGKAQPLDAKVLTPDGWRRMGDLRPGDLVIAGDGSPTAVTGVYPQGEKDIYRVTFSDGATTECCAEHLWLTSTCRERCYAGQARRAGKSWPCAAPQVRPLHEIMSTLDAPHLGAKNHSIPVVEPVAFVPRPVSLDPYLLGVLIGDGCLRGGSVMFSTADQEIVERVRSLLPAQCEVRHRSRYDHAIVFTGALAYAAGGGALPSHPVKTPLVEMGLWGRFAYEKRVPEAYLINSTTVRLGVLRGLMDTDGTVGAGGTHVSFCARSAARSQPLHRAAQGCSGAPEVTLSADPLHRRCRAGRTQIGAVHRR